MYITNLKQLNKSGLRKKALALVEAGYESIDIRKVIRKKIISKNGLLEFAVSADSKYKINLNNFDRVFLIGIGKGSALASYYLGKILRSKLKKGIALDIKLPNEKMIKESPKIEFLTGTHPLPSKKNMAATAKIEKLAKEVGKKDLVIVFICGGGSALACSSKDELTCSLAATKGLTAMGADIIELNTVRKHASGIKGGNLAKLAYPAMVISLIASDVLGDDLEMIASGPTVLDSTTKKDAENILRKYKIDPTMFHLVETPKDKKYFRNVNNILFVSNKDAVNAMKHKARELNLSPKIFSLKMRGEAKSAFCKLEKGIRSGEIILAAGETTVTFNKTKQKERYEKGEIHLTKGEGGRNQEAVLGYLNGLQTADYRLQKNTKTVDSSPSTVVVSFASDGHDNTNAAGAIGDYSVLEKAKNLNLDIEKFLENHDSYNFFKKTGDLILSKKGSFNVADLMVILKE